MLEAQLVQSPLIGTAGIAHTRWATHGVPSVANAHPHTDASGKIFVVHNGIIENWQELKSELVAAGVTFASETDTEVLAQLIGSLYQGDVAGAVRSALARVRGTYGLVVMSADEPDVLVVARMGSPIVLGVGTDEYFVSSDPSALLAHTRSVVYLEDAELAVITRSGYTITNQGGATQEKLTETLTMDASVVQKSGYAHFMLKEIFEAPEVVRNTIRGRIAPNGSGVVLGGLESVHEALATLKRLTIVGCGSAYYSGQVGALLLEQYAGIPVATEIGSEYRYKRHFAEPHSALLAVTQSGETADTLAAVKQAKADGLLTLGIVNNVGSSIARETTAGVYNHAGPEIAVASTKACVSQLTVFALVSVFLGRMREMSTGEATEILQGLEALPAVLETVLETAPAIKTLAEKYAQYTDMMYIGRGLYAPLAYEGALKVKEVSYIHAEAYAGGELKHGSIALLSPEFPVFAIAPENELYEKMVSNIAEVRARRSPVILLTTEGAPGAMEVADNVLFMPKVHPALQPIMTLLPLQLFAYYVGIARGQDVDQPRNLAKSVTVE
jgi:glucosamine--fructose-6-phosphate aminotransferase (isomerizing)